ncbi:Zn(2)-C6 fungal-type domain-containing protein [Mycena kentingensis (nom. inval.)]|nr:Zn(2)-C6 fungal-type domain-containing protein [Mycena kentingensis (nom. inval.)]
MTYTVQHHDRTHVACLTCRKRHIKCVPGPGKRDSKRRSACTNCLRKNIDCRYLEVAEEHALRFASPQPTRVLTPESLLDMPTTNALRRTPSGSTSPSQAALPTKAKSTSLPINSRAPSQHHHSPRVCPRALTLPASSRYEPYAHHLPTSSATPRRDLDQLEHGSGFISDLNDVSFATGPPFDVAAGYGESPHATGVFEYVPSIRRERSTIGTVSETYACAYGDASTSALASMSSYGGYASYAPQYPHYPPLRRHSAGSTTTTYSSLLGWDRNCADRESPLASPSADAEVVNISRSGSIPPTPPLHPSPGWLAAESQFARMPVAAAVYT